MGDWIILRTKGRSTLSLAASLAEDGYEVWTPVQVKTVRIARANLRREVRLPLMASFVFARTRHLIDLLQLADMAVKPRRGNGLRQPAHPDFSVFHHNDQIPLVHDRHLEPLREAEHRRLPKSKLKPYASGADVRITKGSFEGLSGVVESSDGKSCKVWVSLFGRHHKVDISTFMLAPERLAKAA